MAAMTSSTDLDNRWELHCDRIMTFARALEQAPRPGWVTTISRYVCGECGAELEVALTEPRAATTT